jgi:hypothetical protein
MSWKKIVLHLLGELRLGSTNQNNLCNLWSIGSYFYFNCGFQDQREFRCIGPLADSRWRLGAAGVSFPAPMHDDLIQLLRHRQSVIADHEWRDRDAAGQLAALREVSEKISAWAETHQSQIDPRLRHYLANASLAKALAHCEESTGA